EGLHRLAAGERPGERRGRRRRGGDEARAAALAPPSPQAPGAGPPGRPPRPSRQRRLGRCSRRALADGTQAYKRTAAANAGANLARNVWAYAIIFCGHFPDQTYTYSPAEVEDEGRGGWYIRQLTGAANIEGSAFFHVASGNLGYQVEHHLFPDMPSSRYAEIAPQVKDICERYGLPYNSGPFFQQLGMVQRTILRLPPPRREAPPEAGAAPA